MQDESETLVRCFPTHVLLDTYLSCDQRHHREFRNDPIFENWDLFYAVQTRQKNEKVTEDVEVVMKTADEMVNRLYNTINICMLISSISNVSSVLQRRN